MRFFILTFEVEGEEYILVFMSDVTSEKYEEELKPEVRELITTYTGSLEDTHSLEVQITDIFHKKNYKCAFLQNVELATI